VSEVGETLKRLREENDWSQRLLSMKSGVSNTEISRIEDGARKEPSLTVIRKLAVAFGPRENELMQAYLSTSGNNVLPSPETKKPKDLDEFLREPDIMFKGTPLSDDAKERLRNILTEIDGMAKEMNKRKK